MAIFNKVTIFSFFFIIFCLYIGQFLGITSVNDSIERRSFAKFPALNIQDPKLIDSLNTYLTDNFGFRNVFIKQYLYVKLNLLKTHNVFRSYFDDQGMKYGALAPGADFRDQYKKVTFTDKELAGYKDVFEKEKEYLGRKGIPYFLVVIPDKRVIYNDSLPFTDKISVSRHYQFVDFIKKNSSVELIDVTDALMKARSRYPLFFKTDSHWTNFGAFIAYTEVMKRLAKFTEVDPLKEDDFNITLQKYDIWVGDGGLNYPGNPGLPEYGVEFTVKNPILEKKELNSILEYGDSYLNFSRTVCIPCLLSEIPEIEPIIPLLFNKPGSNKLIDTNPGYWLPKDKIEKLVPIVREQVKEKQTQEKIINYLIKASVFPGVVGLDYFLRLSFDKVVHGDDLTFKLDQALIDEYKPDLVIREIIDNRLWEFSRLKCNYDKNMDYNNLNSKC